MQKYGFSITRVLPYNDKIVDSVLIQEKRVSKKPYSCTFYTVNVLILDETQWCLMVLYTIDKLLIMELYVFYCVLLPKDVFKITK